MRGLLLVLFGVLASGQAVAQKQWFGGIEQPFTSNIESEDVTTPLAPPSPTPVVTPSLPAAKASPFTVRQVEVTISETTGFDRDRALEMAARQGLPIALRALSLDENVAASLAKAVGDPMQFVASYSIVRESLIPTYSLLVDMTYNEKMLRANFGGARAGVSGTTIVSGSELPPAAITVRRSRMVVRLNSGDTRAQDGVYRKLLALENTSARYRVMARSGAEWEILTPAGEADVEHALAGTGALVVKALEQPLEPDVITPTLQPMEPRNTNRSVGYDDPGVSEMMAPAGEGR